MPPRGTVPATWEATAAALPNAHRGGGLRPAGGTGARAEGGEEGTNRAGRGRAPGGPSALPSRQPPPRRQRVPPSGRHSASRVTRPSGQTRRRPAPPRRAGTRRTHQLGLQRPDAALVGGLLRGQLPPGQLLRDADALQRLLPGPQLRLPHLRLQPAGQSRLGPGDPSPLTAQRRVELSLRPRL